MPAPLSVHGDHNLVHDWLGPQFARLHPLLQALHLQGGLLCGPVDIAFGKGLGGVVGRRLAAKLGVPTEVAPHTLAVHIWPGGDGLHWDRCFDGKHWFRSLFVPRGYWPSGYWIEQSGAIGLELGVEVIEGGWHWQTRAVRLGRLSLPRWCLPRTRAHKRIVDGRYQFSVAISVPLLGVVLAYSGLLAADTLPASL